MHIFTHKNMPFYTKNPPKDLNSELPIYILENYTFASNKFEVLDKIEKQWWILYLQECQA